MSNIPFKETKFGFIYGSLKLERHISDDKKGWVVIGAQTKKSNLQIYATKTGKIRIHDENGVEWLPKSKKK